MKIGPLSGGRSLQGIGADWFGEEALVISNTHEIIPLKIFGETIIPKVDSQ